jgi:anti-sigma B factor antagonist
LSIAESPLPSADPITIHDGRTIVVLSGELDIAAVPAIREAFDDAIERTRVGVIADLSRVSFIDASAIGALVGAANRSRHLPGGLHLTGIPDRMNKLLRIAGLSDLFPGALPPVTEASVVRYADPAGRNFGHAQPLLTQPLPTQRRASTGVSPAATTVEPAPESGKDAAMRTIPRPRDPMAPEFRSANSAVVWAAAKPDVTAMFVVGQVPQQESTPRADASWIPDLPRPRTQSV